MHSRAARSGCAGAALAALALAFAAAPAAADHHEPGEGSAMERQAPAPRPAAVPEPARSAAPPARPAGRIPRATFTAAVVDREPVGEIDTLAEGDEILFFSELVGLEGQTVIHRWEFEGQLMAEVPFAVGGPRWRVHSSKKLLPGWAGEWTVEVVDEEGSLLTAKSFRYAPEPKLAAEEPAPAAAGPSAEPAPLPAAQPEQD